MSPQVEPMGLKQDALMSKGTRTGTSVPGMRGAAFTKSPFAPAPANQTAASMIESQVNFHSSHSMQFGLANKGGGGPAPRFTPAPNGKEVLFSSPMTAGAAHQQQQY